MCGFESRPGHAFIRGDIGFLTCESKLGDADAHGMRTAILASMARGSVSRRSGGWCFRLDAGVDPATGHRRQISRQGFATKREAVAALNDTLTELNATSPDGNAAGGMALRDYLADWLGRQRPYLRASTWHSYRIAIGRIVDRLGHTTLGSLTPIQVEGLQAGLLASGGRDGQALAAKTVANTHVVLHKALADAVRLGLLDHNVVAAVSSPRVPRPQLSVWTLDQLRDFLNVASSHRLSAAFVLLATTGMRRSEVLGLRWADIDFDDRSVSIIRTLTVVAGRPIVTAPKTAASRRLVYLDASTIDALKSHGDRSTGSRDAYVFQSIDGQPVNPASFSNTFDRLVAQSGLPRIRLHDLRHTYATHALRLGTHPVLLSERLGHTSIAVTIDRYSHVIPSIDRHAADIVAQLILPGPN
jgi:integrase